ncbi:hypothetical protein B0J14DRAFT_587983 [Halenospora varia]|nr:hypothetical protein B0J14DRAFT_587983 [Halenospora varia]
MEGIECSSTNFFSLSREIRDEIYKHALVSSEPVIAWSGHYDIINGYGLAERKKPWSAKSSKLVTSCKLIYSSLSHLSMGLLRCNRLIAAEAARVFYTKNTFAFRRYFAVDIIISWLVDIGLHNRGYLQSIEIEMNQPQECWQLPDGSRRGLVGRKYYERVFQRNKNLHLPSDKATEGLVENIHPAIETIFSLLGENKWSPKLNVTFLPERRYFPGIKEIGSPVQRMDLPNLIEVFRAKHTSIPGLSREVDVLWKGKGCNRKETNDSKSLFKANNWEIVEWREGVINMEQMQRDDANVRCYPYRDDHALRYYHGKGICQTAFTLRKRKIVGKLMASRPEVGTGERYWEEVMGEEQMMRESLFN